MTYSGYNSHHDTINDSVDRVLHPITYDEFLQKCLIPNQPIVLGDHLVRTWRSLRLWTKSKSTTPLAATNLDETTANPSRSLPEVLGGASQEVLHTGTVDHEREIDWESLRTQYGSQTVTVADCSKADSFGNLECESMVFGDVVDAWLRGEGQSLYVKDWHLAKTSGGASAHNTNKDDDDDDAFYSTPGIFADDWINAYYSAHTTDDFRFVYVGAATTFTPLHRDVYCSYSWSTNICGRKRWWLFPPEQTPHLFLKGRNLTVHDVRDVDLQMFPDFAQTKPLVVDQEAGETIFVPSGWYHQVENLTACISINHNWCNSVNLPALYASMCDKVVEVEDALDDVRELLMATHAGDEEDRWKRELTAVVQDLVKQDAGWNWLTFWKMVAHALRGLQDNSTKDKSSSPAYFPLVPPHLRPPSKFIHERVRKCYADFCLRDRFENVGEVLSTTQDVEELLKPMESAEDEQLTT